MEELEQRVSVEWSLKKKFAPLFEPHRYKVIHGGRGAGPKSWTVSRAFLHLAPQSKLRFLCCREFQNSIADSVHTLLREQAEMLNLAHIFEFQRDVIRCTTTGSEFLFIGLHNNTSKIKSMEGVDRVWIEEAESISKQSWNDLDPTIRKAGSEIWITMNPQDPKDFMCQLFLGGETPEGTREKPLPPDSVVIKVTTEDNEHFPEVLRLQMEHDFRVDPDLAAHKWGGEYRRNSDAQILRNKYVIDEFTPKREWFGPYYGADFGFAKDPATVVKCWIEVNERTGDAKNELLKEVKLYVEEEVYGTGIELKNLPSFYNSVNGTRLFHTRTGVLLPNQPKIRCDNSRPETISFLRGFGFNTVSAKKWPGCIEEGIIFLRGLDQIVIHPRCKHTAEEARLYSFKKDRNTGEVTRIILDKHNHCIDAIRYALEDYIYTETEIEVGYEEAVCISSDLEMIDGYQGLGDW